MSNPSVKNPDAKHNIHPLIQKRWSPYSFSEKAISKEVLNELFEAARWSPSTGNEQPWKYAYALKGTSGFDQLFNCLAQKHHAWTQTASVIIVAMKRNTFFKNGNPNYWAAHDLGMANAQLLLQAAHRDIYGHLIAGFDQGQVKSVLSLSENVEPVCMGVLGYLGDPEALNEHYKNRDLSPRKRVPVDEFVRAL